MWTVHEFVAVEFQSYRMHLDLYQLGSGLSVQFLLSLFIY